MRAWKNNNGRWVLEDDDLHIVKDTDSIRRILIGGRLAWVMAHRGYSQDRLSKESGVAASVISRVCSGKRLISTDALVRICPVLDVSADAILGIERRMGASGDVQAES